MASKVVKRKSTENGGAAAPKRFVPNWSMGLNSSMEDPALRVDSDDQVVIIKDKYPKVNKTRIRINTNLLKLKVNHRLTK